MRINTLRIRNYKGFKDSADINFGAGFNVIVGQNNSGKTALLETLKLRGCENRPYRGLKTQRNNPEPASLFEVKLSMLGTELKAAVLSQGGRVEIPIPHEQKHDAQQFIDALFATSELHFHFQTSYNADFTSLQYPSHGLFLDSGSGADTFSPVQPSPDRQTPQSHGAINGRQDNLLAILANSHVNHMYVFKAERLNIGTSPVESTAVLSPDARNLPSVLLTLQGNTFQFEKFKRHVREIFPSIHDVVITSSGNNVISINIWMVPPDSLRNDLTVKLEECGTGVGQVLAILYVAMTSASSIIAIDEPNSFLHPGAAKKLIQILKQYPNQYIISTHSPELISVADPDTIHQILWDGEQSVVREFDRASVEDMQHLLCDVGVNLSDVFGADQVVWVEGHTEELCFPLMLAQASPADARRVNFVRLRNTGDLKARPRQKAQMVWDIYTNLTKGAGILPPVLAFNLDKEDLSPEEQKKLLQISGGKLKLLPRTTYENYLLHPEAIAAIVNAEHAKSGVPSMITPQEVDDWIKKNGGNFKGAAKWDGDHSQGDWIANCLGASLLEALFEERKLQYKKTSHSVELTKWLLDHAPHHLAELTDYVCKLAGAKPTGSTSLSAAA